MGVYTREREYTHCTDAIEYRVQHYEHRYPMPDPPCQFMTFTIADTDIYDVACLVSNGGEEDEEYYYHSKEQQFLTAFRSHCPNISTTCAAKVAATFMEILLIANAAHRCPECTPGGGGGGFTTLHDVYVDIIGPRSSSSHHYALEAVEELVICEVDEDVFTGQRPATRASIAELLKERNEEEGGGECGICMEEMETPRNTLGMPCSHSFHRVCVVEWLNNSHSCPICRYQMPAAQYRSTETED